MNDLATTSPPKPRRYFTGISLVFVSIKYFWENGGLFLSDFADPEQWLFFLFDFTGYFLAIALLYFVVKRFAWRFNVKLGLAALLAVPLAFIFIILLLGGYMLLTNLSAM